MKELNLYITEKLHLNKDTQTDMGRYYDKLIFPILNKYIFECPKYRLQNEGYSYVNSNGKIKFTVSFLGNPEHDKEIEIFKEKLLEHIKNEDKDIKVNFDWDVNHNLIISFE